MTLLTKEQADKVENITTDLLRLIQSAKEFNGIFEHEKPDFTDICEDKEQAKRINSIIDKIEWELDNV